MHTNEKKQLTQAEIRENNIFQKLKGLARETGFGVMPCTMKIHEGHIVEVRPEKMIPVIR